MLIVSVFLQNERYFNLKGLDKIPETPPHFYSLDSPLSRSFPHLSVNFPLTPYGTADSSPAGCSRAVWRERSDPARQAQPANVLGLKLSFLQTLAQLSVQNPLLHFTENILVQTRGRSWRR